MRPLSDRFIGAFRIRTRGKDGRGWCTSGGITRSPPIAVSEHDYNQAKSYKATPSGHTILTASRASATPHLGLLRTHPQGYSLRLQR